MAEIIDHKAFRGWATKATARRDERTHGGEGKVILFTGIWHERIGNEAANRHCQELSAGRSKVRAKP